MNEITLEEAISIYLKDIEKKLSASNFNNYRLTLDRFLKFCGPISIHNITTGENQRFSLFKKYLKKNYKLNDATLYYYFTHLKKFLIFCVSEGLIEKNVDIERIIGFGEYRTNNNEHYKKRIPHAIYPFDEVMMRKYWIYSDINIISLRNALLINLAFDTGLKIGEVLSLKKIDIDFNNNTIYLGTKNKRTLLVPISTILLLKGYIEKRNDDNPHIFINHSARNLNEKITSRSIERIVKFTSQKINSLTEITLSMIRNSYIAKNFAKDNTTRKQVVDATGLHNYSSPILNKFSLKQIKPENAIKNTKRYLSDFEKVEDISIYPSLLEEEKMSILQAEDVDKKIITKSIIVSEYQATEFIERLNSNHTGYVKISKRQKEWGLNKDLFTRYFATQPENRKCIDGMTYIKDDISLDNFIFHLKTNPRIDPNKNVEKYLKMFGYL